MRQLIKFCLVGLSSTIIDKGIQRVLALLFPLWPWWICQSISFCFGVTNGFFWNRRWTFKAQHLSSSREQYPKFVATNLIGLLLNLAFTKLFLIYMTGKLVHGTNPDINTVQIAGLLAIPVVVVWNFSASRLWTFRAPKASAETGLGTTPVASSD